MKSCLNTINHWEKKHPARILAIALNLTLGACATPNSTLDTTIKQQPKGGVVRNITSFDGALSCMDNLFVSNGVKDVVITSSGLPDATGAIQVGSKDIMISAISKMSVRSNAFKFVDFDPLQLDIAQLFSIASNAGGTAKQFEIPQYYIRGAITQFDQSVLSQNNSLNITKLIGTSGGIQSSNVSSVISTDVNLVKMLSRQVIPGVQSNNSIVINQANTSGNVTAQLTNKTIPLQLSFSRNEGSHAAVRTLIQLSMIETLGKLTHVPYSQCLGMPSTISTARTQALQEFNALSTQQQSARIEQALQKNGYLKTGISMESAISSYQKDNDLIANGRIDFDLYNSLLNQRLSQKKSFQAEQISSQVKAVSLQKIKAPVGLHLKASKPTGIYKVGDTLKAALHVTENAYVYCYYQDAKRRLSRIFPNRFSPDSFVAAATPIMLPAAKAQFKIVFDEKGTKEGIVCFAAKTEVGLKVPEKYKAVDLSPIPQSSLDDVISIFYGAGATGISHKKLTFNVQ